MCRPGTLVGGEAQPVGAAVGAAHALCLGGVEVALADHPGGRVAGDLQRGGGGRELHQQGGSRSLEEHRRYRSCTSLASVSVQTRITTPEQRRHCWIHGEARRRCFGSGRRQWRRAHAFRRNGTFGATRSTRPALLSPSSSAAFVLWTQSSLRRRRACRGSPGASCDAGNNPCKRKPFSYPGAARARGGAAAPRRHAPPPRPAARRRARGRRSGAMVRLRGAPVELSQKEFALARTLASDPTRVFTKDELLRTIWGFRTMGSNRRRALYRRWRASSES